MTTNPPGPEQILQVGLGFWASKTLLSAVEMGVFTELSGRPEDALHPSTADSMTFDSPADS
jgi:hypothetical protein